MTYDYCTGRTPLRFRRDGGRASDQTSPGWLAGWLARWLRERSQGSPIFARARRMYRYQGGYAAPPARKGTACRRTGPRRNWLAGWQVHCYAINLEIASVSGRGGMEGMTGLTMHLQALRRRTECRTIHSTSYMRSKYAPSMKLPSVESRLSSIAWHARGLVSLPALCRVTRVAAAIHG